jgi:hypothetical protein
MMVEAVSAAFSSGALFFIEHPEDLGITWNGGDPSSIWAWPEVLQLLERTGAATAALFQCKFGFRSQKPTRVAGTLPGIAAMPWRGYPRFNKAGSYIGPLPKSCGCDVKHVGLIGRKKGGGFNTEGSASYPPPMCKWIADMIIDARLSIQTRQDKFLKMESSKKNLACQDPASTSTYSSSSTSQIEEANRQEGSSSSEGEADEPTSDEEEAKIS